MARRNLFIRAPKMSHGDAAWIADLCERSGQPLVPWQRHCLDLLESASIAEQFGEIVRANRLGGMSR